MYANVAVENVNYSFDQLFTYKYSEETDNLLPGMRVWVPFGRGNISKQAMVMSVSSSVPENTQYKDIISVLDDEPVLGEDLLKTVEWMKEEYYCTYYDAIKTILPSGINYNIEYKYSYNPDFSGDISFFSEKQIDIIEVVKRRPIKGNALEKQFDISVKDKLFKELINANIFLAEEIAAKKINDATARMLKALPYNGAKLSDKQQIVYDVLLQNGDISVSELMYYTGVSVSVINTLIKRKLAQEYELEYYRKPVVLAERETINDIVLNEQQQNVYNELCSYYDSNEYTSALLYGVTGSGKTSVFVKLVEHVLDSGKEAIILVPEISLTAQTLQLFKNIFGDKIALLHSGLSTGERYDEWKRCERGEAKVAVGTRSAVFAPFKNLGLIVLDEEHESSYKSEMSPRYHARDIAKLRANISKGMCLFCSATPSVTSVRKAEQKKYKFLTLKNRYGNAELPGVKVIDMIAESKLGNKTELSNEMQIALSRNLDDNKQSIILINRRGYHTFVRCTECREVVTCPNCSISLTYHAVNNRLMCHYCGYSVEFVNKCPNCGQNTVSTGGTGTQRIEQLIKDKFPKANILRVDSDSSSTKYSLDSKLDAFSRHEYDIMIGTQMVAKGLNFEDVTLVGVVGVDQLLYNDDYKSSERTFDLLTQVVGRAGRGKYKGRALIQSEMPDNVYIRLASEQNYNEFYKIEKKFRQTMLYPPFVDICLIGFSSVNENAAKEAAEAFLKVFSHNAKREEYKSVPIKAFSPVQANVYKVGNRYRYKIIIKCKSNSEFRKLVSETYKKYLGSKFAKDVSVFIDTNPESGI